MNDKIIQITEKVAKFIQVLCDF